MSEAKPKGKSKSWPKIGTLRKGDRGSYISLEPGVEITLNGVKVDINDKRVVRLTDPRDTVQQLFDKGVIDEAAKDRRLEKLSEMAWLRYDLIVPPTRPN